MPGPTAGYQAGIESTDITWSAAQEVNWGVPPTGAYQALRTTGGDNSQASETRNRPPEQNELAENAAAVTSQRAASVQLPMALSFGTFDDLLSGLLRNDWGAAVAIDSITTDISVIGSTSKLTSTLAGKFAAVSVGQWIRLISPLNAGVYRVAAKASATDITLSGGVLVNETSSGTNIKLRGGSIRNARMFKAWTLRKKLGVLGYLHYPGSFVTAAQLRMSLGDFLSGSFSFASKDELKSLVDIATSLVPAPTGLVHENVRGFGGLFVDGVKVQGTLRSLSLDVTNEGASADYGMGSPGAQGMRMGSFGARMSAEVFFGSWDLWDRSQSDLRNGVFTAVTMDAASNAYAVSLLNGRVSNPRVMSGRPGEPVMLNIDIEGSPQPGGGTVQIDRMAGA
jgi:hypothetical protein